MEKISIIVIINKIIFITNNKLVETALNKKTEWKIKKKYKRIKFKFLD